MNSDFSPEEVTDRCHHCGHGIQDFHRCLFAQALVESLIPPGSDDAESLRVVASQDVGDPAEGSRFDSLPQVVGEKDSVFKDRAEVLELLRANIVFLPIDLLIPSF